jgi:hypothetical protein
MEYPMTSKRFVSTQENLEIIEALAQTFRNLKIDETIENKRIKNMAKGKRHLVDRARRMIEREQGCILATVIGIGIKKRPANNASDIGREARLRMGRTSKKAQGRIIGIIRQGTADMDRTSVARVTTEVNRLGFIAEMCSDD